MSEKTQPHPSAAHGWLVTFSGTGINLALGILYTWSIISDSIRSPQKWGWSQTWANLPFQVACLVFAIAMVPAGRMQDRRSPRLVASIGGLLVGLGMVLCAIVGNSPLGIVIGFGVLVGTGIGFGYASATPPAVKWFPPRMTGLIAGLVVSGFGLASVYIAPLASALLGPNHAVETTFLIFGIAFLVVVTALAQLLKAPPAGYVPQVKTPAGATTQKVVVHGEEMEWRKMMKTPQFYLLWLMFFCSSGAGLMVISSAKTMVKASAPAVAVWCVALLAVGNAAGRIVAGLMSDKIGRTWTMLVVFLLQAAMLGMLAVLNGVNAPFAFIAVSMMVGFNYGACLSVFPSAVKDYFGLKNFGLNYGLVFTSWGVGGFVLSQIAGLVKDATGNFNVAYYIAAGALVLAAVLTFITKPPHHHAVANLDGDRKLVGAAKG